MCAGLIALSSHSSTALPTTWRGSPTAERPARKGVRFCSGACTAQVKGNVPTGDGLTDAALPGPERGVLHHRDREAELLGVADEVGRGLAARVGDLGHHLRLALLQRRQEARTGVRQASRRLPLREQLVGRGREAVDDQVDGGRIEPCEAQRHAGEHLLTHRAIGGLPDAPRRQERLQRAEVVVQRVPGAHVSSRRSAAPRAGSRSRSSDCPRRPASPSRGARRCR